MDNSPRVLEALRIASKEVERLRHQNLMLLEAANEPIAIVGMGLRLPGGAADVEGLWQLLANGVDAVGPIPTDRWDSALFYDPDPETPGKSSVREGAFLGDVRGFDAEFFGISPREARYIDPEHRLLLEASWEALENACIVPGSLRESRTGVYVASGLSEYQHLAARSPVQEAYAVTGLRPCFAAGRLAYTLGLQGPALAVDTACSSSLVALHLACQALRRGECDLALAGGAQVMLSPHAFMLMATTNTLASDGRSKTFSAAADGYGRGEGVVVLALERLRVALAKERVIIGLVRGTAVNHDGPSNGITAPNGVSQCKTLRAALEDARLEATDVDFVECHGTGTALGDPIEVDALAAVYGARRDPNDPVRIGALKPNIGHLEYAAGLAGVAKVIAALGQEALPPTIHSHPRNPHVDWAALPLRVVDELEPWKKGDRTRRAAVSSFGISGTNAHVILEEAPADKQRTVAADRANDEALPIAYVISAKNDQALRAQADRLCGHLERNATLRAADVAYSLFSTRTQFRRRAVVVASSRDELLQGLQAASRGQPADRLFTDEAKPGARLAVAFTGQGSQRAGMGRQLYETMPAFRAALDEVLAALEGKLDRPIVKVMFAAPGSDDASLLDQTGYAQPALFALEVALYRLLQGWGVQPDLLLGHSVGEIAAAHASGVLSLADASELVAARARLMQALAPGGAMASVQASEEELLAALADFAGRAEIAAVNGLRSCVMSGDEPAIAELEAHFARLGRKATRLRVSHAFHSARMEPMLAQFERVARGLRYDDCRIPVVSNVTGRIATAGELCCAEYWVRHARQTVRFGAGLRSAREAGVDLFVEVGPHPTLMALDSDPAAAGYKWVRTLRSRRQDAREMVSAAARLYAAGVPLSLTEISGAGRAVSLPTYAWNRQQHWLDSSAVAPAVERTTREQPLLGQRVPLSSGPVVYESRIGARCPAYLADHRVGETVVFPGTGYVELARAAGTLAFGDGHFRLEDCSLDSALLLGEADTVLLQTVLTRRDDASSALTISSRKPSDDVDAWRVHCRATLVRVAGEQMIEAQLAQLQGRLRQALDLSDFYARIEGLEYGASFRGLREIWTGGSSEALGRAALPDGVELEQSPCGIHPALLDACWQVGSAVLDGADPGAIYLPMHIGRVTWGVRATGEVWSHVLRRSLDREHGTAVLDVRVFDALGRLVCDVEGLTLRASSAESLASAEVSPAWLSKHGYRLSWKPTPLPEQTELAEQVVIFTDRGGVGQALLGRLEQAGCRCKSVPPGALDALDRAGCEALLANLCVPGQQPVSIVYLCGLDAQEGAQDWERSQALVYGFPLLLVQALSSLRVSAKLCLASRGAHAVGDAGACVWQSTLTGLCRVLASEHPEYCVRHVDLDPVAESDELCAARLFSEAYTRHDETQTAYRGGVRHVARLTRIPADLPDAGDGQSPCALPRSDGSYLVSGGLGWLGLHSARWLLEHGAGQVVLFGRNPPEGDARAALQQLHGLGGQVTVRALDVSDATAVQRLVDELQAGAYPVRGVVHAAGVLRDAVVVQQSWSLYQEVFKPKALGAWNLHAATERLALDFFVLYSSVTSLFGAPGQANYAASNAFLDALAHHRRAHGLPALSVDWGPWSGGGMALQASRRSRRLGFSDLAPRQGLAALAELLRRGMAQAAVVPIRWPALLEQLGAVVPPLLADWASAAVPVELLHDTLLRLPADQRHARCAAHATLRVRSVLGLGANDALPATQRFNELGLDSLMAAELRNDLARDLALTLSATVAFEYPTIESLSDHLFSEWTDVALRRMLQPESSAADVHAAPFEEMVL